MLSRRQFRRVMRTSSIRITTTVLTTLLVSVLAACGNDASTSGTTSAAPDSAPRDPTAGATSPQSTAANPIGTTTSTGSGTHPCDLLTESEMTDLFGAPVESHEVPYESVSIGVQCLWNRVSESVGGADEIPAHYVLVQVLTDDYDLNLLHRKIDGGGIEGLSELVPDIGDGAILIAGGEGIDVAVGESGFNLVIAVDPVPTPETIKALARSAVTRMP